MSRFLPSQRKREKEPEIDGPSGGGESVFLPHWCPREDLGSSGGMRSFSCAPEHVQKAFWQGFPHRVWGVLLGLAIRLLVQLDGRRRREGHPAGPSNEAFGSGSHNLRTGQGKGGERFGLDYTSHHSPTGPKDPCPSGCTELGFSFPWGQHRDVAPKPFQIRKQPGVLAQDDGDCGPREQLGGGCMVILRGTKANCI